MSEASKSFVSQLRKKDPDHPMLTALAEMSAFEQALGCRRSYYHFHLNGTLNFAKNKGLVRERKGLVRLSPWGREVAYVACTF